MKSSEAGVAIIEEGRNEVIDLLGAVSLPIDQKYCRSLFLDQRRKRTSKVR